MLPGHTCSTLFKAAKTQPYCGERESEAISYVFNHVVECYHLTCLLIGVGGKHMVRKTGWTETQDPWPVAGRHPSA
jgi:hypothetical protein